MKRLIGFALVLIASAAWASTAVLTWTAPTTNTDGTPITATLTYNVYQGPAGVNGTATALTKVVTGATTGTASITTGLTPGTTQCFAVTAVANGNESAQSNQACAAIPFSTPGVPTQITVVVH